MKRLDQTFFLLAFAVTVFYTGFGIIQLGSKGGPCNGGLALVALTPPLLACIVLLVATFSWLIPTSKTRFIEPVALSTGSLLIWTSMLCIFIPDNPKETLLYLGLFELFNALLLLFFIERAIVRKKAANTPSAA